MTQSAGAGAGAGVKAGQARAENARLWPRRIRGWRPAKGREGFGQSWWRGFTACALLVLLPVAGSGAESSADDAGEQQKVSLDDRLDALLSEAVAAEEYRHTRKCLSRNAYRKIKVLNEDYVLFSKGEEFWINKLRRRCPSLKFNDLPVFVQKGTSSLCESDPFYPTNSMDLAMSLNGARSLGGQGICYLGDFEQISAEQAALLRDG